MRLRKAAMLLALLALGASGCSRLTFIKPKLGRGKYTQVGPTYDVREDANDKKRMAAITAEGMASEHLRQGQVEEAERQARAAVAADPKSGDAHALLALVLEQRGRMADAGAEYAKAVALEPQRGTLLNNYAVWLCSSGRQAESLPFFDRALADPAYPTPAAALANAGACGLAAGQTGYAEPRTDYPDQQPGPGATRR